MTKIYIICCVLLKCFVSKIWPKIFSASQIAGFFNQPYL